MWVLLHDRMQHGSKALLGMVQLEGLLGVQFSLCECCLFAVLPYLLLRALLRAVIVCSVSWLREVFVSGYYC